MVPLPIFCFTLILNVELERQDYVEYQNLSRANAFGYRYDTVMGIIPILKYRIPITFVTIVPMVVKW